MTANPSVAWSDSPPPVPIARILQVPQSPIWIVRLGPWQGVWLHWLGKRTFPCLGNDCPLSRHRRPIHWSGYLPAALPMEGATALPPDKWRPTVLPISDIQAEELAGHVAAGRILWEISARNNGKGWELRQAKRVTPGLQLPPPVKVDAVLFRCWGIRPPLQLEQAGAGAAPSGIAAPEGQAKIYREVE